MFRNVTLKCLTEIAGVSVNQYEEQFVNLFTLTMSQLKQVCTQTQLVLSASCINCTQCYNVLTKNVLSYYTQISNLPPQQKVNRQHRLSISQ